MWTMTHNRERENKSDKDRYKWVCVKASRIENVHVDPTRKTAIIVNKIVSLGTWKGHHWAYYFMLLKESEKEREREIVCEVDKARSR